jgi:hypothetical protein
MQPKIAQVRDRYGQARSAGFRAGRAGRRRIPIWILVLMVCWHGAPGLLLEGQEPRASTNVERPPSPSGTCEDRALGLTHHLVEIGWSAAGTETGSRVSDTRCDPAPSLSREQIVEGQVGSRPPQAQLAVFAPEVTSRALPTWLVALVCITALAVLVALIAPRMWSSGPLPGRPQSAGSGVICSRCGTMARVNAHFCHVCGTPWKPKMEHRGFL